MFMHKNAAPMPRYQTVRGAWLTPRPLTPSQKLLLALCAGPMTLRDLAKRTRLPTEEVRAALNFLRAHGLIRAL